MASIGDNAGAAVPLVALTLVATRTVERTRLRRLFLLGLRRALPNVAVGAAGRSEERSRTLTRQPQQHPESAQHATDTSQRD